MALNLNGKALHFVVRVAKRSATLKFYKDILGMKVLRHEEFAEGCEAGCNGPYTTRWSKTMVGYGPEENHFVIELTYNYGIKSYEMGNDFLGITIKSSEILERAKQNDWAIEDLHGHYTIESPDGYKFSIIKEPQPTTSDPVMKVTLACSNLKKTIQFWHGILGLKIIHKEDKVASFAFDPNQCLLEFKDIGRPINHAKAYGRIAFSVPKVKLAEIEKRVQTEGFKVITPMIILETPGKSIVTVIIVADPDGHEICFVDEEGFRDLGKFDPEADNDINKYIKRDKNEKVAK